ncbi:hypothetical protein [Pseudoroseomonas ludipueritiae]|uniref:Uncharacterized protein n=1 Tax=Pseudoroseomonas ludipueritiae TaxID=198093 RepID=A0ABR7RC88_9PROT|nr:hypothetical protein [Pseudoroseomonas ludipueritiae]MBC9179187.1 hypothetical protein [Pseudoroseomonas ludipueritiae]MCG7362780.1 hypothetical protein [Roseomonas sp. ACRSG]
MDTLRSLADYTIRRAMGLAALVIAMVMLLLAPRPMMALQSGALMTAALWLGMWAAALRVHRMDLRGTRLWPVLAGEGARHLRSPEGQRQLAAILAERLLWHADRAGMVALGLGGLTLAMFGYSSLPG